MVRRVLGLIAQSAGILVAAAFITGPSSADTLPITSLVNGPYALSGSDSVSLSVTGAQGSTGATSSGSYFDYLFQFSISQDSYISATIGPVGGADFSEMHMMFYDSQPSGPDENLYTGADLAALYTDPANPNPNLIDVGPAAHWSTAGSVGHLGSGGSAVLEPTGFDQATQTPYHLVSLSGDYWFRVFGILSPDATELALSGTITSTLAPAPIPAALPLFLSALGGLGIAAHRRRKATAASAA